MSLDKIYERTHRHYELEPEHYLRKFKVYEWKTDFRAWTNLRADIDFGENKRRKQ
ncbi:hypothetical protein JOC86_004472 [Bacillus pakistanensis]|uniref:Transposase n=1 Tax=Rossellomorea pakistanensis TaxID=992288 RepID=A0ABS2NJ50_9BACI|nr:hypothetical protein [Bacillus pakistanensis]